MKKSWVLSIIMSFVLLGGVFAPAGSYAAAADDSTTTYSEDAYSEVDTTEEEPELTADEADFLNYMDQLDSASVYEEKAFDALGGGFYITSSNRKSVFLKLTNTAIPNYTKYVSKLKLIKPQNTELQKIHANLIKGSYTQLEGFQLAKKAVSKTTVNSAVLKQANAKIDTGKKNIEKFQKELSAYANKLGYEF
ncbi:MULTISPECIES: hypothetical protein [Paenibacillus]|uniref:hypothetical protein n=1 Tax=Paenibacillus TaxID=44249 RepID=UPI0007BFB409|nr:MULTISPECIES: hypothetical protein [Paenibacillus]WDQ34534.1 hypothetical protein PTQ21_09950 [Paenibacillus marchantiae]SDL15030.1 hypothetical protein SAMN05428961_10479 [Paenibacillus sp. OK060]SEB01778.1 hypothetical protein SAMN03159332_2942 [Paenibacillus sp. 276b]SLK01622.1 hypothetical protein SAMN06272722_10380 [Paenibacillus sp. RU5A]SOC68768.1 hypothetical protein SAMN05880581_10380 [Paenibacillus sp. RU26A]